MSVKKPNWDSDTICIHSRPSETQTIAADIYRHTCRTHFREPGFCLINAGNSLDSVEFRMWMVDLKLAMSRIHESVYNETLVYLSARSDVPVIRAFLRSL